MSKRGFSLVEVVIAIMILTVGILGLAASATAITRMTSEGGRSGGAAGVASSRFEQLRATAAVNCANLAAGSATTGRYAESWTIATTGLMRTITVTVRYPSGRGTRTSSYTTNVSCAPKAV